MRERSTVDRLENRWWRARKPRAGALLALLFASCPALAEAATSPVVIREVFTAAPSAFAPYNYVQLFNRSQEAVDIGGWSLQYASATGEDTLGAGKQITVLPGFRLEPGQSYIVQEAGGAPAQTPRVLPDARGTIVMGVSSGTIALVRSPQPLGCNGGSKPCSADQLELVADLLGYGNTRLFRGSSAGGGNGALGLTRYGRGCADSQNNRDDFSIGGLGLSLRNSAAVPDPCGVGLPVACNYMKIPENVWMKSFDGPSGEYPECPDCTDGRPGAAASLPACAGCFLSTDPAFLFVDSLKYRILYRSDRVFLRLVASSVPVVGSQRSAGSAATARVATSSESVVPANSDGAPANANSASTSTLQVCIDISGLFYESTPGSGIALPAVMSPVTRATLGFSYRNSYGFEEVQLESPF